MRRSSLVWIAAACLLIAGTGCEAFVKKFRRQPKKENRQIHEFVLQPESYGSLEVSKKELARQYYLFWRSWHEELIQSLIYSTNHKKQIETSREAALNLSNLVTFFRDEYKEPLNAYIARLEKLHSDISRDVHGMYINRHISRGRRLKREIEQEFPASRLNEFLNAG